jgi:hypothetical protein
MGAVRERPAVGVEAVGGEHVGQFGVGGPDQAETTGYLAEREGAAVLVVSVERVAAPGAGHVAIGVGLVDLLVGDHAGSDPF